MPALLASDGVVGQRKLNAEICGPGAVIALLAAFSATLLVLPSSQAEEPRKELPPKAAPERPTRVYADAFLAWIYKKPSRDPAPIGYIRAGDSVALRAEDGIPAGVRAKTGCGKGWYAVAPAGYICLDHTASLTPTRYAESMQRLAPRPGPYPFDFVLSMGSPSYRRVPTENEWLRKERIFGEAKPRTLPPHWQGHEELVTDEPLPIGPLPAHLTEGGSVARSLESRLVRRDVPFGSMLAVTGSFVEHGRAFLKSADGTIVPADRFRTFRPSTFQGVDLDADGNSTLSLPLAWPRKKARTYSLVLSSNCAAPEAQTKEKPSTPLAESCLKSNDEWVEPRKVLSLSGRVVDVAGARFAELGKTPSESSHWLPLRDLFRAEHRPRRGMAGTDTKWIHFTIGQGTLVTYRGDRAVFATLASPGIGGVPSPGADPLNTRTTPVGTYRIQFKHRTDDMSPEQTEDRSYWIADVPFAMYFQQPFAIHVAYWHESFGEPMSGGCINVSPRDGERLFSFADPPLPEGWYGVGASREFGLGTTVVIDR